MKRILAIFTLIIAATLISHAQMRPDKLPPIIGPPEAIAKLNVTHIGGGVPPAGDYCSTQTWATFTPFKLDLDHTTDSKNACISSGTETGSLSANTTVATPGTVSPGSGAAALYANGNNEYITFSNNGGSSPYFVSTAGQLQFAFNLAGDNANNLVLLQIYGTDNVDELRVFLASGGQLLAYWEDNDGGAQSTGSPFDVDSGCGGNCYGKWVQVWVGWNTGGAGTNEVCIKARYDSDSDGDFTDESWTSPSCWSGDADAWGTEPDAAGDITFGLIGTYDYDIYFDDLEFSTTAP